MARKEQDEATTSMNLNVSMGLKHGTNILDIEVPPQLEKTISSGIPFIDDAFGGEGLTPSSSVLFTGTPGAGKTTLMLQLCNSWTQAGNIALYNTNEEAATQVRKVVKRLSLTSGFFIGDDRLVSDVIEHAKWLAKRPENKGKQLLIVADSLQTLDDGKYSNGGTNSMTQVRVTEMLTEWCKSTFGIAVLIGQVTKSGDFAGKQQIKHTVDAHAHLFIDDKPKSETYSERIFEVQKNRFGCNGRNYILGMDKAKGIYEKASYGGVV